MLFEIKHRVTGAVLFSLECGSMKLCVEAAVKSGANLADADLAGANLARADLARANLAGADLAGADLAGADLAGADLAGADLAGADLAGADLADADLAGANLARANLAGAYLAGADLAGAYLARADLAGADLAGADLARADLAAHLGYPNRWPAFAWVKDNQICVQVGCKNFTISEGREYWRGKENRREVLAALDYAEKIAELRGWLSTGEK